LYTAVNGCVQKYRHHGRMKKYHILFLVLKVALLIQFMMVFANKLRVDSTVYILTEILFKTSLGIFIEFFMFHTKIEGILFEDKLIISFAGALLLYDAWFNDIPVLLEKYGIHTPFTAGLSGAVKNHTG
jgi:hypothetical protein